jgi:hypothetical protein
MKTSKSLFLILFLTMPSLSKELALYLDAWKTDKATCLELCIERDEKYQESWHECVAEDSNDYARRYDCDSGESVRTKTILKNPKITMEPSIRVYKYVPKNQRVPILLKQKSVSHVLNDIKSRFKLVAVTDTANRFITGLCYEINIYDNEKLIASFETNGVDFYDGKNKTMYTLKKFKSETDTDLLYKYWGMWPENHCK